jgi:hypothetical protein
MVNAILNDLMFTKTYYLSKMGSYEYKCGGKIDMALV